MRRHLEALRLIWGHWVFMVLAPRPIFPAISSQSHRLVWMELFTRESDLGVEGLYALSEAVLVDAAGTLRDVDAVVQQHFDLRDTSVGEEVGMVRLGCAEDLNNTAQCRVVSQRMSGLSV